LTGQPAAASSRTLYTTHD